MTELARFCFNFALNYKIWEEMNKIGKLVTYFNQKLKPNPLDAIKW